MDNYHNGLYRDYKFVFGASCFGGPSSVEYF